MYTEKSVRELEKLFATSLQEGLSEEEARARLLEKGENRLLERKKKSVIQLFFEQLCDPLIYILMAAIVVSLFLKEAGDACIIGAVILLNAGMGVIQEGKARKAIEALKKLTSPRALVLRNGREQEIDSAFLVQGDIVLLESGRQVPADIRLTEAVNLRIEEAALTGESLPSEKIDRILTEKVKNPGDRKNMAYMTTMVTCGRGRGIVTATGMDTEIGRIAGLIEEKGTELTPLQKRLSDLGKILSIGAVLLCLLLFLVAVVQKRNIGEMLLTAISLAVAAVPEGLPAIVTIVMALSVSRMVKAGTIIRKLPSVETLGAVNVVCSDKTGTLTQNRMTVKKCYLDGRILEASAAESRGCGYFLESCVLCNDAELEEEIGDPTELSLLAFAAQKGYDRKYYAQKYKRTAEKPFDSERKRMTTVQNRDGVQVAYCKGAADGILQRCSRQYRNGKEVPFSEREKREVMKASEKMAGEALRVLAFAMKTGGKSASEKELLSEENLTFLGLTGMIDPPREGVKEAVESFRRAGVRTVMITGDHVDTALAIARELSIADLRSQCMTGDEIASLSEREWEEKVEEIRVFARVSPEHKVRIVEALRKKGRIVAMTGDGINDAPSLKAADVGIAMGKEGTDVARNAADMVLTDDNFTTIEKAMREGRGIYENIRKTILFLLSSNFGEIMTMLAAVLAGFLPPLKASHILWVNLITDSLPALALGADENDTEELMRQPPRKSTESLFAQGGLSCMLCYGVVIGTISLLAFLTVPYRELLLRGLPVSFENIRKSLLITSVLNKAQTHAFTVLGMSQLMHAIGMRDVNKSLFKMNHRNNPYMLVSFAAGILLQVLVTEIPYFVELFGTSRLTLEEWGVLLLLSAMPLVVHELLVISAGLSERAEKDGLAGEKGMEAGYAEEGHERPASALQEFEKPGYGKDEKEQGREKREYA